MPPARIAVVVGVFFSVWSVIGLLVGASITHNIRWHSTFFFIAPRQPVCPQTSLLVVCQIIVGRFFRTIFSANLNRSILMRKCLSASQERFTTILIADRPILCQFMISFHSNKT
ncbi:MAG TPA: hypothetical protein VE971_01780 [Candidatus Eisenbacteria bacterium]|nr:hypothetical protein [Candidatus Eisenbacteria bacterium]